VKGHQGIENEHLKFPMSMGDPRLDKDHSAELCTVLDVVYGTQVLELAQSSRQALLSLSNLPGTQAARAALRLEMTECPCPQECVHSICSNILRRCSKAKQRGRGFVLYCAILHETGADTLKWQSTPVLISSRWYSPTDTVVSLRSVSAGMGDSK